MMTNRLRSARSKIALLFGLCLGGLGVQPAWAQLSQVGQPLGLGAQRQLAASAPVVQAGVPAATRAEWLAYDAQNDGRQGRPRLISRYVPIDVSPTNAGAWSPTPQGGRVWRLRLHSPGAQGLTLFYDDFQLAPGAQLFVYTPEGRHVQGAFTQANNSPSGRFVTGLVPSDLVVLELHEPPGTPPSRLHLDRIGYAYRDVPQSAAPAHRRDFGDSESCQVNARCSEGSAYADQQNATVRILLALDLGQSWCTGTLMNTTAQTFEPLILTAEHCGLTFLGNNLVGQSYLDQWVFYFNYQSPGCTNPASEAGLDGKSLTGCIVLSHSNDGGGDSGSDFLLLRAAQDVPANWNQFYAGWDATNTTPTSGVCLHHPAGDIMKVSTYTAQATSSTWGGQVQGTHWTVTWAGTANGHGVTEGGSSGSALYNAAGRVVGTLTGGTSYCTAVNDPDDFGKMAYHWASNGTTNSRMLQPWLDNANLGVTVWDGAYAGTSGSRGGVAPCAQPLAAYPTPVAPGQVLSLQCQGARIAQVQWADATGRALTSIRPQAPTPLLGFAIPEGTAPGVYLARATTAEGHTHTCRVVVAP